MQKPCVTDVTATGTKEMAKKNVIGKGRLEEKAGLVKPRVIEVTAAGTKETAKKHVTGKGHLEERTELVKNFMH